MNVLFGELVGADRRATNTTLVRMGAVTERFAPCGTVVHVYGRVGLGTQLRSLLHPNPPTISAGFGPADIVVAMDGRVDNATELHQTLNPDTAAETPAELMSLAYRTWGEACFGRFLGDWSLVLWDQSINALFLSRDHAGTRTMFFRQRAEAVSWSTYIDALLVRVPPAELDTSYAAFYLGSISPRERTPYSDIKSVLPGHYVKITPDSVVQRAHWSPLVTDTVRYKDPAEYDAHFLHLFSTSVARRVPNAKGVIAQLSGGVDSTSIVCVADMLARQQGASIDDRVDTLSYFDRSEPNWDEEPYFTLVERQRGKEGIHVSRNYHRSFQVLATESAATLFPGADSAYVEVERATHEPLAQQDCYALVSGVGGDELLGGVPYELPELVDYGRTLNVQQFARQSIRWALDRKTTVWSMLQHTAAFSVNLYGDRDADAATWAPWLSEIVREACAAEYERRRHRFNPLRYDAKSVFNRASWNSLVSNLPHHVQGDFSRHEYRYPYLDRELVEFIFRVPRHQLLQPGRRRAMMRRALASIVPQEVLERKRKAFIARGPLALLQQSLDVLNSLLTYSVAEDLGFIDRAELLRYVKLVASGTQINWWRQIVNTIMFEIWLRARVERVQACSNVPIKIAYSHGLAQGSELSVEPQAL